MLGALCTVDHCAKCASRLISYRMQALKRLHHDALPCCSIVEVQLRCNRGPPPEHVPRNVTVSGRALKPARIMSPLGSYDQGFPREGWGGKCPESSGFAGPGQYSRFQLPTPVGSPIPKQTRSEIF